MANLISPGVQVTIDDESFYIPGAAACVPLIILATADAKVGPDGVTPAEGTYEHGVIRSVTSISQSLQLYGIPRFLTDSAGNAHHGDARNEYGLDALNKFLEIGNRAYVVRANVNLNDNLLDIKKMWTTKIEDAADYLHTLVDNYIAQYNAENNLVPADSTFKLSVTAAELKTLLNESLTGVLTSYSFSSDVFENAFIQDHTITHSGYQDVLFETSGGYLQLSDITGLTANQSYSAQVTIVSSAGTSSYNLAMLGSQVVTFNQLVTKINTIIGAAGTCQLLNGRLRITSSLSDVTSAVHITSDGPSGYSPLFATLNLYKELGAPVSGTGIHSLNTYDDSYLIITGSYDGLDSIIDHWTGGTTVGKPTQFTGAEAEGLLLAAAADFDNTKEFKDATSLGANDAARRAAIVKQLQAVINDPSSGIRADYLEYNIVICPGYFECADELVRLSQAMLEEVFVIGETPFDKPPTGPNGISNWANTPAREVIYHIGYYYAHGISSNIDGANIMTSAGSTALRVIAYNDKVADVFWGAAGTSRGLCPHLTDIGYVSGVLGGPTTFVSEYLDNGTRDELYSNNINPITFIPGRGILVLGQKTGQNTASALDRINVSRLVKLIKRGLRKGLFPFLFEPNDKITWDEVKAAVDGYLSDLINRRGLYDFATQCNAQTNTPTRIDNNQLWCLVAIKPTKSVEFIYVPVKIVNTGADIGGRTILFG